MPKPIANPQYYLAVTSTVAVGGTGFVPGDTAGIVGGTFSTRAVLTVSSVSSGGILTFVITVPGNYSIRPTNPVSLQALTGIGTGATINAVWVAANPGFTSIRTYGTNTAGVMPTAGTLRNRELYVNTADQLLWVGNTVGQPVPLTGTIASQNSNNVNITGGSIVFPSSYVPTLGGSMATKGYVDDRVTRNALASTRVATTVDLGASFPNVGLPTVDGLQLVEGDRVLVWSQINATQNGVYNATAAATGWMLASDANVGSNYFGAVVVVISGATYAGTSFLCTTASPITIGTSLITFQPTSVLFPIPLQPNTGLFYAASNRLSFVPPGTPQPVGEQAAILQAVNNGDGTTSWNSVRGVSLPTNPLDIVNKSYADSILSGVNPKQAVAAATTMDLTGGWTYDNNAGTLTSSTLGASSIPVIDGYTPILNDRLLIKNEGTQAATAASVLTPGSGYSLGQTLQVVGGDIGMTGRATTLLVTGVASTGVASAGIIDPGLYTTLPTNPVATIPVATSALITFNLTSGTTNAAASTFTLTFTTTDATTLPATVTTASIPGGSSVSTVLTALTTALNTALAADWTILLIGTGVYITGNTTGPRWTSFAMTGTWSLPPASGLTVSGLVSSPGFSAVGSGATFNLTFSNTQFANGLYQVTQLGANANPPAIPTALPTVLTRTSDANTYAELVNAVVSVTGGTTQAGLSFVTSIPQVGTLGTTNIIWVAFGGTGTIVPVTRGGTGLTSVGAGLIPFGNNDAALRTSNSLYWDGTNLRLGLNTQSPVALLHVEGWSRIQQALEKVTIDTTTLLTGTVPYSVNNQALTSYAVAATGNWVWNFTGLTGGVTITLNSLMPIGTSVTVSLITTQGATPYYCTGVQVDGIAILSPALRWQGPIAPSFGNANSRDVYTFVILKTADATFSVLGSRTQYGG